MLRKHKKNKQRHHQTMFSSEEFYSSAPTKKEQQKEGGREGGRCLSMRWKKRILTEITTNLSLFRHNRNDRQWSKPWWWKGKLSSQVSWPAALSPWKSPALDAPCRRLSDVAGMMLQPSQVLWWKTPRGAEPGEGQGMLELPLMLNTKSSCFCARAAGAQLCAQPWI